MLARKLISTSSFDAASIALFVAMSVQPSPNRKRLLNSLIKGLKYDGVWSKVGWLSIVAAHDAQAGRLNIVNPAQICSAVSSPTFTTDRGYTGNGSSAYLDCGIGVTAGGYAQNSAFMFAYSNLGGGVNKRPLIGTVTGTTGYIEADDVGDTDSYYSNRSTVHSFTSSGRTGSRLWSRTGASTVEYFKDGASLGIFTDASVGIPGSNVTALQNNGSYTPDRVAAFGIGSGLTTAEAIALQTRVLTYLTAIGAN